MAGIIRDRASGFTHSTFLVPVLAFITCRLTRTSGMLIKSRGGKMETHRVVVVLVHDEADVVDLLRGLFEAHGFGVDSVATLPAATRRLAALRSDVIVAAYDNPLGKQVASWVREHGADLCHRLLYVADEIPARLQPAAAQRRIVRLDDLPGLLEAADAISLGVTAPRALLVEDDPSQREEMGAVLERAGFAVTSVKGGHAATALLAAGAFDIVLSDWLMDEGSGDELHRWMVMERPTLLPTLVFMTGGDPCDARASVNVPVMPKGQDSPSLLERLRRTMGPTPTTQGTPARGTPVLARRQRPTRPPR